MVWAADDDHHVRSRFRLDEVDLDVRYTLDSSGHVHSAELDRWGDPDNTGTWGLHSFGLDVTSHATFDGMTIPQSGTAGWFHGSERWDTGEFFRFEITRLQRVAPESSSR